MKNNNPLYNNWDQVVNLLTSAGITLSPKEMGKVSGLSRNVCFPLVITIADMGLACIYRNGFTIMESDARRFMSQMVNEPHGMGSYDDYTELLASYPHECLDECENFVTLGYEDVKFAEENDTPLWCDEKGALYFYNREGEKEIYREEEEILS